MNLVEYQELSKRTMPFNGEPANPIEFENMLGNYAMGLVGEAIEAFRIQPLAGEGYKYELGDVLHYAVGLACAHDITLCREPIVNDTQEFLQNEKQDIMDGLLIACGEISEKAKKRIYHRHIYEHEEFDTSNIIMYIAELCKADGFEFSEIMQMNITKLKTRYPEKFNTADSIARVDTND